MQIRRDFSGIAYHFIIDSQGRIFEGRPLDMLDAHVGGANTGAVGIALIGNFDRRNNNPTVYQMQSMFMLVGQLQSVYSIPNSNVGGHRDYALPQNPTVCPGGNLQSIIERNYR